MSKIKNGKQEKKENAQANKAETASPLDDSDLEVVAGGGLCWFRDGNGKCKSVPW